LPAAQQPAGTGSSARVDSAQQPQRHVAARVLVVDDNKDAAELLAEALRAMGHRADAVFDPLAALKAIPQFSPDVVLLDIGLPVMDGYELAEKIRHTSGGNSVRLFAVTGYGQTADRRRSLESGFEHHLSKPVDLEKLDGLIRKPPGQR
jgi:CheY-like chemotaxis protein